MLSPKDRSEITRNWLDVGKSVLIIGIFSWLAYQFVFDRQSLKRVAEDLGIERFSGPGFEVSLAKSSDALPRAQAALVTANTRIAALEQQYIEAVRALSASSKVLRLDQSPDANARELGRITAQVLNQAPATFEAVGQAKSQIKSAATSTAAAIKSLPGAQDESFGFGVVFGADRNREQAERQLSLVRNLRPGQSHLFRRQGSLRSVVVFDARADAVAALPQIQAINSYAASAYVVNLASWCPKANLRQDPVDCGS